MPVQPEGELPPIDGELPAGSLAAWGERAFGIYVHVPFCSSRCGYCDFNTYTTTELAGTAGVDSATFDARLRAEISIARRVLGDREVPVSTVFLGGGTPTLLRPQALGGILAGVDDAFGLVPGAEVSIEANPDSVDARSLGELRSAGFTRVSFGMQSAAPHVLKVLDRTHKPGGALRAVELARAAGFDMVSLDLIYGTPGESLADWGITLDAALASGVGHISAYALIVETGTRLAAAVRRGIVAAPDDDLMADMYELADERLNAAGLSWYELSNWAAPGHECQHNLAYWRGSDWWGVGPGAHSHVGGTRWWNVKHPGAYVQRLADGLSPAIGREMLDPRTRRFEALMLGIRMVSGIAVAELEPEQAQRLPNMVSRGLGTVSGGRFVLTRPGRLLADAVLRELVA
ncbi:MAG: radical SAM family heme chaperone HemW [Candidatus Nanopelagicales bacterium]